jgi:hypothetical protein
VAFTWTRERPDGKIELRTLPYELGSPARTTVERLGELAFSLDELEQGEPPLPTLTDKLNRAFDVEAVTKKFYQELANWFFWARGHVQFPMPPTEKNRDAYISQSLIRLITRLIFCWFVKEMGLIPRELFDLPTLSKLLKDGAKLPNSKDTTFYKAILQNLFFATLNQEIGQRQFRKRNQHPHGRDPHRGITNLYRYEDLFTDPKAFLQLVKGIPFLNGGLFECLDQVFRAEENRPDIRIDGFSDHPKNPLSVPDFLFFGDERTVDLSEAYGQAKYKRATVRGLIHIFERYNFTVTESTPLDQEVALDPELAGKVFENLLAAYNPETATTARKATGSYYTPRPIVEYMVDEALLAYLKTKLDEAHPSDTNEARLRHLLAYNDDSHQFSQAEVEKLIAAIDNLKALDPACGSGAFLMGLLHKLVFILGKLDPHNERWKQRQIAKASEIPDATVREKTLADIEKSFAAGELDYGRKLYLIENCIYGVDIQPIAVQIAKMRFFISLTIDQKIDPSAPNLGIRPLPNLETKFVAANTLIGLERPAQKMLRNPQIDAKEAELRQVRERHFTARTPATKAECRELDAKLRAEIRDLLRADGFPRETTEKLANWNPYDQNASADFFDPEWMFGIRDGFDIVIGNPPYLESRSRAFPSEFKESLLAAVERRWPDIDVSSYVTRGADLLVYFLETSLALIQQHGNVVLITQNAWLDTEYGKRFQEFLLRVTHVSLVVDSDFKHFDSSAGPNVNTVITFFRGRNPEAQKAITFARFTGHLEAGVIPSSGEMVAETTANVRFRQYRYDSGTLRTTKWGILLSLDDAALDLLSILEKQGTLIERIPKAQLSVGQGLNLTKEFFLGHAEVEKLSFVRKALIPILTAADGAPFEISGTHHHLADARRLSKSEIAELRKNGIEAFDPTATTKIPPVLILPRGIGRHFCAFNPVKAYSASAVDIYPTTGGVPEVVLLNLWVILNSSATWLLREVAGRKNLGGGMLKAEATDLATLPLYIEIGETRRILKIADALRRRQSYEPLAELETEEHQAIDALVFEALGLTVAKRSQIVDSLKRSLYERARKART